MNPAKIVVVIFTLAAVLATSAYDLQTRDGKVYKEIRLREKTALGIRIAHEGGVAFIDYSQIPVPDLWTFGYVEADYIAAKNPPPTGRPVRLYQSTQTSSSDAEVANSRPPIGTNTLLSRPSRSAGSGSSGGGGASSGGSSTSGAARSQCAATTQKGYRCSRLSGAGSAFCWQHD